MVQGVNSVGKKKKKKFSEFLGEQENMKKKLKFQKKDQFKQKIYTHTSRGGEKREYRLVLSKQDTERDTHTHQLTVYVYALSNHFFFLTCVVLLYI